MKKFTAILLTVAMILSLAACAGGGATTGNTGTSGSTTSGGTTSDTPATTNDTPADTAVADVSDEPVTLKVWMDNDDWAAAVIEAFNAIYPNVTIDFQNVGNTDSHAKISLDGPAGVGADVFFVPHDQMARVVNDGLSEPVPADRQQKYDSELITSLTFNGDTYGVPIQTENIALFYNKDLWGPTPPETFEEVIEFAKTYNDPAAGKYAMAWQLADSYANYHWLTAGGMSVFGPNNDDFRSPGFDTPEAAKGVEYYLRLHEVYPVPVAEGDWNNTVERFKLGEIPLTISGPWAIADSLANGVNFGVAKIPTIDGKQPVCFSGLIVANVSSYSENEEWAYKFVDFLVSQEGAGIMYDKKGTMTTRKDISEIPGLRDDEYLSGIAQQSPYTQPMPMIAEVDQMWESMKCLFQFTWDGDMTIEEAQAKAMDTYRTLLAAAGKSMD